MRPSWARLSAPCTAHRQCRRNGSTGCWAARASTTMARSSGCWRWLATASAMACRPGYGRGPWCRCNRRQPTDWFERITGFRRADYVSTRSRLEVDGEFLISKVNGNRHRVGQFEVVTLQNLRARRAHSKTKGCHTSVHCLAGDARDLHARPEFAGATFQVASQFNLLEMVGPSMTPEDGVTRYIGDRDPGPGLRDRRRGGHDLPQLPRAGGRRPWPDQGPSDRHAGASGPGARHSIWGRLAIAVDHAQRLCAVHGGCAFSAICHHLRQADEQASWIPCAGNSRSACIAVAVTDVAQRRATRGDAGFYGSALPIAYSGIAPQAWEPFARLVLEAAYEATLLAAAGAGPTRRSRRPCCSTDTPGRRGFRQPRTSGSAMRSAGHWTGVRSDGLDVRLVSYGSIHPGMQRIQASWGNR